jgi:branched-chain amino acid transport system permease protein
VRRSGNGSKEPAGDLRRGETVSGIAVSLQIVFAAIVGGIYAMLGPTVGALLTISLNEGLRVAFATNFIGAANTIYGILLVLCIIQR